jgi:hypothetical protein
MHPRAGDEAPHEPPTSAGATWNESWSFDFLDPSGVRGEVRLSFSPVGGTASWWTRLDVPDIGLVVVRDDELSLPRRAGALVVRGDGLWADLLCETPFEHWTIGVEAFGLLVDDVADEVGERIPVGLDLEWEVTEGDVIDAGDSGYGQAGTMRGEVLVGDARLDLDAPSQRQHRWGP